MKIPYSSIREEELSTRIEWFIKLRWLFLLGLFITILVATQIFKVSLPLNKILIVTGVLFVYNSVFYFSRRFPRGGMEIKPGRMRVETNLQMALDLVALSFLIHFSGGVENPFIYFYLFHAIIGSILLSRTDVSLQSLGAFVLFVTFVALEYFDIIPHYHLEGFASMDFHRDLLSVSVKCLGLLTTILITIYMSSSIVKGLRDREKELFLTRNILDEKSRNLEEANLKLTENQKQLVQAEKLASLGGLVSGIAHEINNPTQFILGNMRIIKESFKDILPILDRHVESNPDLTLARLKYPFFREQSQTLLDDMTKGAERIRNITADLKTFARRDESRPNEEIDLNEVVRASLRLAYNKVKHYKIEENMDPELPKLWGSESKLEQVIIATLINAAEALNTCCPDGTIKITTQTEDNGKSIKLSISDNGPGMTEETKNRIFDPFFTTKQRTGGTGLGLSVIYGIIEEHGGQIDVMCQLGKGTTFTYYLPVKRNI